MIYTLNSQTIAIRLEITIDTDYNCTCGLQRPSCSFRVRHFEYYNVAHVRGLARHWVNALFINDVQTSAIDSLVQIVFAART